MQKSLDQIARLKVDLTSEGQDQELSLDIDDYKDAFAEEYCRPMITDMRA